MQINLRLPPAYRYLCQYEIQQQTNDRRKPPVPDGMDGDYPSTGPQLEMLEEVHVSLENILIAWLKSHLIC